MRVGITDEILVGVKPVMGTGRRPSQWEPGAGSMSSRNGNGPSGYLMLGEQ